MTWAAILGALVVIGVAGWLVFVTPVRRLVRHLRPDESGIRIGKSEVIRWSELREIRVETTGAGPWLISIWSSWRTDAGRFASLTHLCQSFCLPSSGCRTSTIKRSSAPPAPHRRQLPLLDTGSTVLVVTAAQPAVADGGARRSLRSLSRPPLNGSIVGQLGRDLWSRG
jgi:hypothetical protein